MSDGGRDGTSSAAKRRRERRLRAARRHEQPSVRMALAAASAPKCAGPETHEAPRRQTTARAAGKRPAPLAEVSGPQEAAVAVGYVAAARAPSLATPWLADAASDAVDAAALEFLVWAAFKTPEQIESSKQASWRKQKKRGGQEGEGGGEGGGGGVFFSAEKEKEEEEEEAPEDPGATSSSGVGPQLQFLDKVVFVVAQRQILMVVHCLWVRPSYLAVTCLLVLLVAWFDSGYMFTSVYRGLSWRSLLENVSCSAHCLVRHCVSLRSLLGDDDSGYVFTRLLRSPWNTLFFQREGGHGSRCSHLECGHYLSALYAAVNFSVSAAPGSHLARGHYFYRPLWATQRQV